MACGGGGSSRDDASGLDEGHHQAGRSGDPDWAPGEEFAAHHVASVSGDTGRPQARANSLICDIQTSHHLILQPPVPPLLQPPVHSKILFKSGLRNLYFDFTAASTPWPHDTSVLERG